MNKKTSEDLEKQLSSLKQEVHLQKKEIASLRKREQRCKDIFENANDLIHSLDSEGRLLYANRLWRETLGYTEDEIKKMKIFDIVDADYQSKCISIFNCMMRGEQVEPTETIFVAKDGQKIMVEGRCNPKYEEGKAVELLGIFRDITNRKLAEKKIEQAAREWRNTFDSISDFVSVHDTEMRIIKANRALTKFLDTNPENLIGKYCYEAFHGTKEPWENCPHTATIKQREPVMTEIDDPKIGFPLQVTCSPFFDDTGNLLGTVHIARDISDAKRIEKEKENLISELKAALSEVKVLSGLLPICSSCKKIRDDEGYWHQIDQYITEHSEAVFSHGMCKQCSDELYGGQEWYDESRDEIIDKEK